MIRLPMVSTQPDFLGVPWPCSDGLRFVSLKPDPHRVGFRPVLRHLFCQDTCPPGQIALLKLNLTSGGSEWNQVQEKLRSPSLQVAKIETSLKSGRYIYSYIKLHVTRRRCCDHTPFRSGLSASPPPGR